MKLNNRALRVLAILPFWVVISCSSQIEVEGGLEDRDPALAFELFEKEQAVLLDVRTPVEFNQRKIPDSNNIWIEELSERLEEVEALTDGDKSRPIVVYCTVGVRAARAKRILLSSGYMRVTNMGSLYDWPDQ